MQSRRSGRRAGLRFAGRCVAAPLLAVLLVLLPAATPAVAAGQRIAILADPRIDEASGLAIGHRSPSVLYVHNDSGDRARFFAVDAGTGRTRAVCTVTGARNIDWEDLATGPDSHGVASVWLADIGDNDSVRSEVDLYRVDEPVIGSAATISTGPAERWRLRYPDGPHDAESLIADPVRHRLYLVTKSLLGHSQVFLVPAAPDAGRVQPMTQVATVTFGFTGTPGGPNVLGQLTATGASMSTSGSLLAIRTYTDAYLWPVVDGDVAGALRRAPVRVPLPDEPQGEGIALGSGYLLVGSEGSGSAIYRLPLPDLGRAGAAVSRSVSGAAVASGAITPSTNAGHRWVLRVVAFGAGPVFVLVIVGLVLQRQF
ncbi:MAG: hypothetical protein ACR2N4_18755 [Jatrophihabitans sp.]